MDTKKQFLQYLIGTGDVQEGANLYVGVSNNVAYVVDYDAQMIYVGDVDELEIDGSTTIYDYTPAGFFLELIDTGFNYEVETDVIDQNNMIQITYMAYGSTQLLKASINGYIWTAIE